MGIVGATRQVRAMKPEHRVPRRDGPLAPGDRLGVYVDAIVATAQVADQAEGEIANSGPDVQHAMLW